MAWKWHKTSCSDRRAAGWDMAGNESTKKWIQLTITAEVQYALIFRGIKIPIQIIKPWSGPISTVNFECTRTHIQGSSSENDLRLFQYYRNVSGHWLSHLSFHMEAGINLTQSAMPYLPWECGASGGREYYWPPPHTM